MRQTNVTDLALHDRLHSLLDVVRMKAAGKYFILQNTSVDSERSRLGFVD